MANVAFTVILDPGMRSHDRGGNPYNSEYAYSAGFFRKMSYSTKIDDKVPELPKGRTIGHLLFLSKLL